MTSSGYRIKPNPNGRHQYIWLNSEEQKSEIGQEPISNPKSQISDWTRSGVERR